MSCLGAIGWFAVHRLRAFTRSKTLFRFVGWSAWQPVAIPYGDDLADLWAKKMKRAYHKASVNKASMSWGFAQRMTSSVP